MKDSKNSDAAIVVAIEEHEDEKKAVADICLAYGEHRRTFYDCKKKYSRMDNH